MGLKIAMVSSWACRCGIASYSRDLSYALAQEGVEVYIVRLPRFGTKNAEIMRNIAERIPLDTIDLIHVQEEYGLYQGLDVTFYNLLKQLKKPVVTTMHSAGMWEVDEVIAQVSSKVIVHNEFCRSRFEYPNTVIIPHGATPSKTTPVGTAKKSVGVDPRIPIVGYLGFISSYKGIETIIEAMRNIEDAGLLIAGGWFTEKDTEYMYRLKEASFKALPNRVQWLGFVPDEKLPNVYGAMDVLVYPSRFATESGALITALSYGKAVISSDLSPFKEKEKLGALMTFENAKDLEEKIKFLLKDADARRKLEEAAMKYATSTSWSVVAKQHIKLYQEVLDSVKEVVGNPVPPAQ
jgi:glycosyltransferase involved in cell wall biosynthesis